MIVWKSISVVKAAFSLLAWLLFSVFVRDDKTYESLEKRDFTLLDDIAQADNENDKKQTSNINIKTDQKTSSIA